MKWSRYRDKKTGNVCQYTIESDQGYRISKDAQGNYHAWAPGRLPDNAPQHYYASSTGNWHCFGRYTGASAKNAAIAACEEHLQNKGHKRSAAATN